MKTYFCIMSLYCAFSHYIPHVTQRWQQCFISAHACCSALCQSRHGDIPDSSLQSTGSSRSSHSRSPSLHHMHEEDKPVPRRSHSHGYPHGHSHRGRLRSVRFALTSSQTHLYLVMTQLNEIFLNKQYPLLPPSPNPCLTHFWQPFPFQWIICVCQKQKKKKVPYDLSESLI